MTSFRTHDLLSAWLRDHRAILAKVARSFARDEVEVRELEQEMAFQLWRSASRFSGNAKPSTWIYRICLNTALTWRRTTRRREQHIEPNADHEAARCGSYSPAETAEQREWLEKLYQALHQLAALDRALLVLMLDGLSYREIGDVTGMNENHVGVALNRAKRRLAEQMKGVTDELG